MNKIKKWIYSITIYFTILFGILGCTPIEKIVVQDVYIPVKCQIALREKPNTRIYDASYLKEVLTYSDLLRKDLEFCINGNINGVKQ